MDTQQFTELNRKQLGKALRGLRLSKDYTLEDLGFYVGKDVAYISRIENGKVSIKFDLLSEVLAFYQLAVKEFYDRMDEFV